MNNLNVLAGFYLLKLHRTILCVHEKNHLFILQRFPQSNSQYSNSPRIPFPGRFQAKGLVIIKITDGPAPLEQRGVKLFSLNKRRAKFSAAKDVF